MFIVMGRKLVLGIMSLFFSILFIVSASFLSSGDIPVSTLNGKKVVIDAGHGGMDGGSVGEDGTPEKLLNLEIALKLKDVFLREGYEVILTREEDISLHENDNASIRNQKNSDLKKRTKIANESGAGLFISIHTNKYESPDVFGAQVFYEKNDKAGETYAKSVMESLRELDQKNKRLSKPIPNPNLIFKNLKIPGILVECGFISNPDDLNKLKDESYQQKIAEAIYKGVSVSQ